MKYCRYPLCVNWPKQSAVSQFPWWQAAVYQPRYFKLRGVHTAICHGQRYTFERGVYQNIDIQPWQCYIESFMCLIFFTNDFTSVKHTGITVCGGWFRPELTTHGLS
jgi:hypothetical protein